MKIVTYNLHYGGKTGEGNHWERIMDEFSPDLVLAQESFNPEDYFPTDQFARKTQSAIWAPVPAKWGSAIIATRHELTPIVVPGFEGWVAGGRIAEFSIGGVAKPLSVFSIHTPSPGPYEKKVNDILDCIQNIAGDSDMIMGGDFNITTAVRHPSEGIENRGLINTKTELAMIDRLRKEFGLVNAWQAIHPNRNLPQTLRWTGNKNEPYHCDGIFIPHSWLRYLESCEVASEGWSEMSDHNPIVATFNVQPEKCT